MSDNVLDLVPEGATKAELDGTEELRKAIHTLLKLKAPPASPPQDIAHHFTKATLLRFYRARNGKISKASQMFEDMINWYRTENIPKRIEAFRKEDSPQKRLISKKYPCGLHGIDKRGVPVYWGRYGIADAAGLERECGYETYLSRCITDQQDQMDLLNDASAKHGKQLVQCIAVLDMDGMEWKKTIKNLGPFKKMIKVLDDNYPERLKVAYVVRAPWLFTAVYKLVSPMLSADTKAKVRILGKSSDHVKELSKDIDIENIPDWLGGKSTTWKFGCGGVVAVGELDGATASDADEGEVKTLEVSKLEKVGYTVEAGKTVIWEWRVVEFDINFSVASSVKNQPETDVLPQTNVAAEAGWQQGSFKAPAESAANLTFTFDNSYSWTRGKQVEYKIETTDLLGDLSDLSISDAAAAPIQADKAKAPKVTML